MLENLHSEQRTKMSQVELNTALTSHERYARSAGGMRAMLKLKDLGGLHLANRRIDGADFAGASLVGANAYGSSFIRASLYCADLRFCNMRYAKLNHCDLRGASFGGADLAGATLDCADMRVAIMVCANADGGFSKLENNNGNTGATDGVDFRNASLRNVSFGNAKLVAPNFSGALLHGARFAGATLADAKFEGAVLTGVNLAELKVPPEALKTCITDPTAETMAGAARVQEEIDSHALWVESGSKHGKPAILDGADLRPLNGCFKQRNLVGLTARNVLAIGVDFGGCFLQGAKFDGADLRGANFTDCNLLGTSFKGAKLHHARFDRATLGTLELRSGTNLSTCLENAEAQIGQFGAAVMKGTLDEFGFTSSDTGDAGSETTAIAC